MSDIAIRVEQLGKAYRIGLKEETADTMAAAVGSWLRKPLKNFQRLRRLNTFQTNGDSDDIIWALKDVSFDVKQGEVLGVIGRNGAGKSTLLKILSRITEPTKGRATIHGRVSSLLEVGTGFHPELSGRENVYLNGTILGMTKREIDRKFDEIVDFSGVEKFLDTPVKRYSSGMRVRLAFSVAAHLDPEILVIDEVLAVGDAEFQGKCLGKMEDVSHSGRTVLFVSHNMGAVETLCTRVIMLRNGRLTMDDTSTKTVSQYLSEGDTLGETSVAERTDRRGRGRVKVCAITVNGEQGGSRAPALAVGRPVDFTFWLTDTKPGLGCRFTIMDCRGFQVAHFNSMNVSAEDAVNPSLGAVFACHIDELVIAPGHYRLNVAIFDRGELEDHVECAAVFKVQAGHLRGRPVSSHSGYGAVCVAHRWATGCR